MTWTSSSLAFTPLFTCGSPVRLLALSFGDDSRVHTAALHAALEGGVPRSVLSTISDMRADGFVPNISLYNKVREPGELKRLVRLSKVKAHSSSGKAFSRLVVGRLVWRRPKVYSSSRSFFEVVVAFSITVSSSSVCVRRGHEAAHTGQLDGRTVAVSGVYFRRR